MEAVLRADAEHDSTEGSRADAERRLEEKVRGIQS